MNPTLNQKAAAFFTRALLGVIFLMQGYGKVFTFGMDALYNSFAPYEEKLPKFLVVFAAYFTTYAEFIGGFLLLIGLFRNYTLYALGVVLLIVSFGHGLSQPIWDLSHVFPRAVLLIALLVMPQDWDQWQIERLVRRK